MSDSCKDKSRVAIGGNRFIEVTFTKVIKQMFYRVNFCFVNNQSESFSKYK